MQLEILLLLDLTSELSRDLRHIPVILRVHTLGWPDLNVKNQLIKALVSLLKSKSSCQDGEKRFLILSTTGLGDTLWATPAIRALRESFPTSYIGVLTSPIGKDLLRHNPRINELFVVKNPCLLSLLPLYFQLKSKKFTHVLNFHTSQRPILPLSAILGAQEVIGTRGLNKGLDFLLTKPLEPARIHEIQRRLNIISEMGAHTLNFSMELFLSAEEDKCAEQFLLAWLPRGIPCVALHPGAKDGFKQWPTSHFIELGNRLVQNLGCRIIVTGTPAEKALVHSITSQIKGAVSATDLPLLVTAALLKRMHLMISNDTGPMHLALAVQTPTIGLFTPTDPNLCGPYFVNSTLAIAKKPTCSPCLRKKCAEPFCLLQIGVNEVYDAVVKLLSLGCDRRS